MGKFVKVRREGARRMAIRVIGPPALGLLAACASLDGLSGDTRDAGHDVSSPDATTHDGGGTPRRDAVADTKADVRSDGARDAGGAIDSDVGDTSSDAREASCTTYPADAMPEGGHPVDPGVIVCNTGIPSNEGGVCNTLLGEFCCGVAEHPDSDLPPPLKSCQAGGAGNLANLVQCLANNAPIQCDETDDCAEGDICCFAPNPVITSAINGQYVKLCAPPSADGGCALAAAYGPQSVGTPELRVCKRDSECGPCGHCSVFCCNGVDETELCGTPSEIACLEGACAPNPYNDFQDDSETDVDCGGRYLADGGVNDASDQAVPCARGFRCRSGHDCQSGACGAADDAGVMRCQ